MSVTGFVEIEISGKPYRLSYTNSDLADADDYMREKYGQSFVGAITGGGLDIGLLRVAFFYGIRGDGIRSLRQVDPILNEANIAEVAEAIGRALEAAFRQSGMVDDSGEA